MAGALRFVWNAIKNVFTHKSCLSSVVEKADQVADQVETVVKDVVDVVKETVDNVVDNVVDVVKETVTDVVTNVVDVAKETVTKVVEEALKAEYGTRTPHTPRVGEIAPLK